MMASKQAVATISKLLEHTTTKPIPEDNLDTWVKVLEPLDDDLAVAAALRVVRRETKTFAVPPGAVFVAARELLRERYPSEGEAWQMARGIADGSKPPPDAGVGPFLEALDQVGRRQVREIAIDDFSTRALFLRFYREEVDKAVTEQLAPALAAGTKKALTKEVVG